MACTVSSTPDFPWVLLQMTRLGPGPPSHPLSGSSCPSTELRSAAERRRAADPSLRQPPVPIGGGPLPLARSQPSGTVWLYPWWFSGLCVWGMFLSFLSLSVSQALVSLWVRHLVLGVLGPGCCFTLICPLHPSHPSLLPTWPLSTWPPPTPGTHALFPPWCSSLPAPCLEIPKTRSLHLLNFAALCLGRSLRWEAPSSCPSGLYSFPLSPPVTTMTAGRRRRPCPQLPSPRNLLPPRRRPRR